MNMNTFAERVASREGKKKQTDIAQIKETLKCTLEELGGLTDREIIITVNRYRTPCLRTTMEGATFKLKPAPRKKK